jgi:hypothetical protein
LECGMNGVMEYGSSFVNPTFHYSSIPMATDEFYHRVKSNAKRS